MGWALLKRGVAEGPDPVEKSVIVDVRATCVRPDRTGGDVEMTERQCCKCCDSGGCGMELESLAVAVVCVSMGRHILWMVLYARSGTPSRSMGGDVVRRA